MSSWTPTDWIELLKAVGGLLLPLITIYMMYKQRGTINLLEKNTNSMSERLQATAEALGVTKGINIAASVRPAAVVPLVAAAGPVPVTDKDTKAGLAAVVDAIEKKE